MQKKIFTGLVVASMMLPALASAQSTNNQSQIQTLLSQIQALQSQLKTLVASSTAGGQWNWKIASSTGQMNPGQMGKMVCVTINRNLRQGDQGDDVRSIQKMLMDDPESGFQGSATGFFGPLTMKAMAKFQTHMGIASSSDGSVGPMTRGFFERRCGKGEGMGGGMTGGNAGNSGPGNMGGMGGMMMGTALRGTISSQNGSSIVVQTDGGNVTVNVTSSTTIKILNGTSTAPTNGSLADLIAGKKVVVEGAKNADGSVQARAIAVGDVTGMIKMIGEDFKDKLKDLLPNIMLNFNSGGPNGQGGQHGSLVPGGNGEHSGGNQ